MHHNERQLLFRIKTLIRQPDKTPAHLDLEMTG